MDDINVLDFIVDQLGFLNGNDNRIGLIEDQEKKIDDYLDGRDEQSLGADERQYLRRMRNELEKRRSRREELTVLRDRYEDLSDEQAREETLGKVNTINTVYTQRKQRKLGENIAVSTREPDVHYRNVREGAVDLSISAGNDISRDKPKKAMVIIGAKGPVGRVKGDSLEIMKQMITLSSILKNGQNLTVEHEKTIKQLLEKMSSFISRNYDYTNEYQNLMKEISENRAEKSNIGEAEARIEPNVQEKELKIPSFIKDKYEKNLNEELDKSPKDDQILTNAENLQNDKDNDVETQRKEESPIAEKDSVKIEPKVQEEELKIPSFIKDRYEKNLSEEQNKPKQDRVKPTGEKDNPILSKPKFLNSDKEKSVVNDKVEDRVDEVESVDNKGKKESSREETPREETPSRSMALENDEINKNKVNVMYSLIAMILKFLKTITKIIPPVSNFFEGIEDGFLGSRTPKMLNSAEANKTKSKIIEKSIRDKDIVFKGDFDYVSDAMKFIKQLENDKSHSEAEKSVLDKFYKPSTDTKEQAMNKNKVLGLKAKEEAVLYGIILGENVPEVFDDEWENIATNRAYQSVMQRAEEEGISTKDENGNNREFKSIYTELEQKMIDDKMFEECEYVYDAGVKGKNNWVVRQIVIDELKKRELDSEGYDAKVKEDSSIPKKVRNEFESIGMSAVVCNVHQRLMKMAEEKEIPFSKDGKERSMKEICEELNETIIVDNAKKEGIPLNEKGGSKKSLDKLLKEISEKEIIRNKTNIVSKNHSAEKTQESTTISKNDGQIDRE